MLPDNTSVPMVSCIMPTYNRRAFVPHAIRYFLRQDWPRKELIIIDDGTDNISDLIPDVENIRFYRLEKKITLGAKMNLACNYAKGNIVVNWDDDDWYSERRLSYQLSAMEQNGISVCGINNLLYYDLQNRQGYQYIYPSNQRVWLLGSSLCFTKELWKHNTFADINVGMDGLFVWATPPDQVKVLEDPTFSVHMIHSTNICPKNTKGGYWHSYPADDIRKIMDSDWDYYINNSFYDHVTVAETEKIRQPVGQKRESALLKNVYACLVHEDEDCIIDLVRNLHYHDPSSQILIYNGSDNPGLLTDKFPYNKYNVLIHPSPLPQKHGYLHTFALHCMEYAIENIHFDTFTIVDSDQLALRSGYSAYLSDFFSTISNVGMLSNMPKQILPDNKDNHVALQAFKEYELWKPLLDSFPDGKNKFVHWTFWPSTVFTVDSIRKLVVLFRENEQLKKIMQLTKIWATEEVIFPTLIKLLGYEIVSNPCSYDFVKYRKDYKTQDIEKALKNEDAFWIHPIPRKFDDQNRSFIRERFNDYTSGNGMEVLSGISDLVFHRKAELINMVRRIEGWLSDNEADLLISITLRTFSLFSAFNNIVEIGSYHGKSTILFGRIISECRVQAKVYAFDKHDGKLGAADQGLRSYPPSFIMFKRNIKNAGLTNVVEIIRDWPGNVGWKEPVSLLFIDGLHDYRSVAADFNHFSGAIKPGGFVAFHDYADYFPGVKKIVHEILLTGLYGKIQQADSLVILQKLHEPYTTN